MPPPTTLVTHSQLSTHRTPGRPGGDATGAPRPLRRPSRPLLRRRCVFPLSVRSSCTGFCGDESFAFLLPSRRGIAQVLRHMAAGGWVNPKTESCRGGRLRLWGGFRENQVTNLSTGSAYTGTRERHPTRIEAPQRACPEAGYPRSLPGPSLELPPGNELPHHLTKLQTTTTEFYEIS